MLVLVFVLMPAFAATYCRSAQSGPSGSYAGGMYYDNYKRVPITGDNRTDLIAIALRLLGYQEGASNGSFSDEISGRTNYVEFSYNLGDLAPSAPTAPARSPSAMRLQALPKPPLSTATTQSSLQPISLSPACKRRSESFVGQGLSRNLSQKLSFEIVHSNYLHVSESSDIIIVYFYTHFLNKERSFYEQENAKSNCAVFACRAFGIHDFGA